MTTLANAAGAQEQKPVPIVREEAPSPTVMSKVGFSTPPAGAATGPRPCPALSVAGPDGTSTPVTYKLQAAAQRYIALYDAWWLSVVKPPYPGIRGCKNKPLEHRALDRARHQAWQTYATELRTAGITVTDRRDLARWLCDPDSAEYQQVREEFAAELQVREITTEDWRRFERTSSYQHNGTVYPTTEHLQPLAGPDWLVDINLRVQLAASYLYYLDAQPEDAKRRRGQLRLKSEGAKTWSAKEVYEWAEKIVRLHIKKANDLIARTCDDCTPTKGGGGVYVRRVEPRCIERLHQMGLSPVVTGVDTEAT